LNNKANQKPKKAFQKLSRKKVSKENSLWNMVEKKGYNKKKKGKNIV
jgi:hypothetical protein